MLAQVNIILRLGKGRRPSFCHELNFLKICKGFIRDLNNIYIYSMTSEQHTYIPGIIFLLE